MQYWLEKRKEFEMELCLREKNCVSAVDCSQKCRPFALESDQVSFQYQFFCSTKYPKLLLEFCNILITDYLVAVVLFSRTVTIGQHCNDNVQIS